MKTLIIYNPTSGREQFKNRINSVLDRLEKHNFSCDVYPTKRAKDATERAQLAAEEGYELIILSGGDGTFNEVINGIARCENKPIIGYIPTGTVNDVATTLRIPKNIDRAIDNIINGEVVSMDVGKINDDYFAYVTAFGMYTRVSYEAPSDLKTKFGKGAYVVEFLKDLTTAHEIPMEINYDDKTLYGVFSMGMIINSHTVAGFPIINKPRLNDGSFDVVLFEREPKKDMFNIFRTFLLTIKNRPKNSIYFRAHKLRIKTHDNVKWNSDGEFSALGSIELECLQEHIKIIVPKQTQKRLFKKR